MQKFIWSHQIGAQGDVQHRNLVAQFGDGYAQRAADGINTKQEKWPLSFVGTLPKIEAIKAFLNEHAGYKTFLWTPPLGSEGAYVAPQGYQQNRVGGGVYSITVTFVESNRLVP